MRRLALASLLVLAAGCTPKITGDPPDKVVTDYLDASTHQRNLPQAYTMLCKSDRDTVSEGQFIAHMSTAPNHVVADTVGNHVVVKVLSTDVSGRSAKVRVSIGAPDQIAVRAAVMTSGALAISGTGQSAEIVKKLDDRLAKVPLITHEQSYDLVAEDGQWKINLHWADLAKQPPH